MTSKGKHWHVSDEIKEKQRKSHLGKKYKTMSEQGRINIGLSKKGIPSNKKGKSFEEMYGKERAEQIKKQRINKILGTKQNEDWKRNRSKALKGKTYEEIYGIEKAKELKLKRAKAMIGFKHTLESKMKIKEKRKKQIFPKKNTKIEEKIEYFLKCLNKEFYIHYYISEIEHGYQCDFYIPSINLVIECDGDYWHDYPNGREIDHIRTKELQLKGFKVVRLWEHDIKKMKIEEFIEKIE